MESEEITKLVDGVYKNILEKFNPGARQLITAGKAYLKALHGAASASRLFNDALAKIAMNAQQSGTNDIGSALMNVVSVYKEIQDHQMNILKAFYVDLLVPLETNLEKDTKVVQHEQKKFLQQHKVRIENYHKAANTMKKQRKKKSNPENNEKEIKSIQQLEEQKTKLLSFCDQSYKNAMTQERRRYGFVLERQCSLAKHWMAYHANGSKIIESNLDNWMEVANSREIIPASMDANFVKRMEKMREEERNAGTTMMKKARSVDAPFGDMRTLNERQYSQNSLPRAKSDFNLTAAASSSDNFDQRPVVRALYAYMPSGENQLPFAEGDRIALIGSKSKGWQFGENLRTQMFGWFPIAYTNAEGPETKPKRDSSYENMKFERNAHRGGYNSNQSNNEYLSDSMLDPGLESDSTYRRRKPSHREESSPTRMFGDTLQFKNQRKYRGGTGANPKPGPPPSLPAPVPSSSNYNRNSLNVSQSFCSQNGPPHVERRKHKPSIAGASQSTIQNKYQKPQREGAAKTSLHSSNDSGFANEPPPQPEIDYSDEEHSRVPIRRRNDASLQSSRDTASWTLSRNFRNSNSHQTEMNGNGTLRPVARNFENSAASDEELLRGHMVKRTKSFWKFGKSSDDILAGMSLWQHRDLVEPAMDDEIIEKEVIVNMSTMDKRASRKSIGSGANEDMKMHRQSYTPPESYDDENIYGVASIPPPHHQQQPHSVTPKNNRKMMKSIDIDIDDSTDVDRMSSLKRPPKDYRQSQQPQEKQQQQQSAMNGNKKLNNGKMHQKQSKQMMEQKHVVELSSEDSDDNGTLKLSDVNNFFDDEMTQNGGMKVIKTFKRQDILKQYYSSEEESDAEVKSTSSDPYDCIVINDHLVKKDDKSNRRLQGYSQREQLDFQTFRAPSTTSQPKNGGKPPSKGSKLNNKESEMSDRYNSDSGNMSTSTATILPRTKLMKSTNNNLTLERNLKKNKESNSNVMSSDDKDKNFAKAYGPWYDFWDNQELNRANSKMTESSKAMK